MKFGKRTKNKTNHEPLYWVIRYISIFVSTIVLSVLISICLGTYFEMIFSEKFNLTKYIPYFIFFLVTFFNMMNIYRYQECWENYKKAKRNKEE